ncbi:amino acid adenylation domain-containing protein [Alteromonadaceae bacterium 2753L.S.0a.02]|nr:amino acid adenylation domain-containing protein [Alteromonadaceae bacterium 2753L.S.0a.02]
MNIYHNVIDGISTIALRHMLELCVADDDASRAYSDCLVVEMQGDLNRQALRNALQELVTRHEMLRAIYDESSGNLLVEQNPSLDALYVLLSENESVCDDIAASDWVRQESNNPFILDKGPLVRFRIARLAQDRHLLLMQTHHLICDGWSQAVLLKELADLYNAYKSTLPDQLGVAPNFRDYAEQLNNELQSNSEMRVKIGYWKTAFEQSVESVELPAGGGNPKAGEFEGYSEFAKLSAEKLASFEKLARENRCTLNMFLYSTYVAFLHKISGNQTFIVPISTSGRYTSEFSELVGHCTSIVPIFNHVSGDISLEKLIDSTKKAMIDGLARQEAPYAVVLEELVAEGRAIPEGVLRTSFNYNVDMPVPKFAELHSEYRIFPKQFAASDLLFNFTKLDDGLLLECNYSKRHFASDYIQSLIKAYLNFVENAVLAPGLSLRQISLVGKEDIEKIDSVLANPSREKVDQYQTRSMLNTGLSLYPDKVAIADDFASLTFSEFNELTNQLGNYLVTEGVECVGLYLPRSSEMLVSMIACLKAGITYVPLDTANPVERTQYIHQTVNFDKIISCAELKDKISVLQCGILVLDNPDTKIVLSEQSTSPLVCEIKEDGLAYILFTSGSTGNPKGVMVTHSNLANYLSFAKYAFVPEHVERVVVAQPLVFDASINAVLPGLCHGKSLRLIADDNSLLEELPRYLMAADSPTMFTLTPSHLSALRYVEEVIRSPLARHHFIVGGEPLPAELMKTWADELLPAATFINQYGPTEATVGVTQYLIKHRPGKPLESTGILPIGRANDNVRLYVLDSDKNIVPAGFTGELYIGGPTVAKGYINNPEQSSSRFIKVPELGDGYFYRTGDRVYLDKNGDLHFVERLDNQVKLRGYRIELDEIRSVIQLAECTESCAVGLTGTDPDNKQISAYVCLSDSSSEEHARFAIKCLCEQKLPAYMVPSNVYFVATMPLTTNGKVDFKKLESVAKPSKLAAEPTAHALTDNQEKLAVLWRENLNCEVDSAQADYLTMGGNSLLAIRLINAINKHFGVRLHSHDIWQSPRLHDMENLIASKCKDDDSESMITSLPASKYAELSYAQQRMWFLNQLEEDVSSFNIAGAIRLQGEPDLEILEESFKILVERHEVLRSVYTLVDGDPKSLVVDNQFQFTEHTTEFSGSQFDDELMRMTTRLSEQPFDLERELSIRVATLRNNVGDCGLIVCLHHIAADGWSLGVVMEEVKALYGALLEDKPVSLPELAVQYRDFAAWQFREVNKIDTQASRFWTENLSGWPEMHALNDLDPEQNRDTFRGKRFRQTFNSAFSKSLHDLARQQGITLFQLFRASFAVLISQLTGEQKIVFGTPVAGRPKQEFEKLVGLFVNNVVLCQDIEPLVTVPALFAQIKNRSLQEAPFDQYPFNRIVENLRVERSYGKPALFNIMLSMQPDLTRSFVAGNTVFERVESEYNISKYDLMLDIASSGQEITVEWEYREALFSLARVEEIAARWDCLLRALLANPSAILVDLIATSDDFYQQQKNQINFVKALGEDLLLSDADSAQIWGLVLLNKNETPCTAEEKGELYIVLRNTSSLVHSEHSNAMLLSSVAGYPIKTNIAAFCSSHGEYTRMLPMHNQTTRKEATDLVDVLKNEIMATGMIQQCFVRQDENLPNGKLFLAAIAPMDASVLSVERIASNVEILVAANNAMFRERVHYEVITDDESLQRAILQDSSHQAKNDASLAQHIAAKGGEEFNQVSEQIVVLWKELLGKNDIDTSENFFALGGHSLLVVKMRLKINEIFNTKISIQKLFDLQTIPELAGWIVQARHVAINAVAETVEGESEEYTI